MRRKKGWRLFINIHVLGALSDFSHQISSRCSNWQRTKRNLSTTNMAQNGVSWGLDDYSIRHPGNKEDKLLLERIMAKNFLKHQSNNIEFTSEQHELRVQHLQHGSSSAFNLTTPDWFIFG
jgi:hypothetical protein